MYMKSRIIGHVICFQREVDDLSRNEPIISMTQESGKLDWHDESLTSIEKLLLQVEPI